MKTYRRSACMLLALTAACLSPALRAETDPPAAPAPLVDAPSAVMFSSSFAIVPGAPSVVLQDVASARTPGETKLEAEAARNTACEQGELHGKPCRVSWLRVLGSSFIFLTGQSLGNISMDSDTRSNLFGGPFWHDYVTSLKNYRYSRWRDDDPFGVDWIGHPMMGALTSYIYEQNDPKQRALTFENTHRYWMGRLRAMAYSAAYSAEWKVGPISEASIGNTGLFYYTRSDGVYTNETGMQDFFVTPIGGLVWNVGEDAMDRYVFVPFRRKHQSKMSLIAVSFLTPMKSGANLLRFRPPYYRDPDKNSLPMLEDGGPR